MQQIRIQRPRARRERPCQEALPPDPRDPDVVRAKALARAGDRAGGSTARQSLGGHARVVASLAAAAALLAAFAAIEARSRHGLVPVRLLADRNRQQVGGSTGLAVLGTVAWTVIANSVRRVDLTGAQQPAAP